MHVRNLVITHCAHLFCRDCISPVALSTARCPTCKAQMHPGMIYSAQLQCSQPRDLHFERYGSKLTQVAALLVKIYAESAVG